ncbi:MULTISPECIES: 2-hydroxyacid dehydrogenase [Klebsiella]|uniref:2-hydroxyacid dehydrogenase n=1 Tax=Klebsiella TaxID=570 RepID=UPI002181B960|nr:MULTISPECIES: 2-hydroxyacid dehydrogenase [Klebsiella]HCB0793115.1 2-hydroxyacid dehydrogenase [Klebsiella variicola subsp. variicola]MDR6250929.1 D-3-phosphoglycerate dehydrogenase [Klebsiella variicola]MDR6254436.1 D-3-phosphoglycerate dehydrogenase [Klebsiella variicola]MDR6262084.1 D-3-phosphoglycerate dehydrogenase [Klebsiella sp. SORGH_AS_0826]MDR6275024.1 D-3-phosphoglycerate dehydrogenase [Klebsiella variicola]
MKCLAIADLFINKAMMAAGLSALRDKGIDVEVREWSHASVEKLQEDNLRVEQEGAEAVALPAALLQDADDVEILITQFAPVNTAVLDRLPKLKYIGVLRGGVENVNQQVALARGIEVMNTPGRNARSVAEFTVGMMLAEMRNIARSHDALRDKFWRKDSPNHQAIPELGGKVVGLVGLGHIAQLVAGFLSAFGTEIIFYDKYVSGHERYEKVDTLDELVTRADVVSLHARMTPETENLINAHHFGLMKSSAIIVNTARSGLINERDLIDALQTGKIMGAALDTFDDEPLPDDSAFYLLNNVTITPHIAGSTLDAFSNSPKLFAEILLKKLS